MRDKHYWPRYCKFIAHCKARKLNETSYTETHHILPRSLGGTSHKANLIKVTAREHYLAHWLLAKSFTKTNWKIKMLKAFGAMCGHKTKRKFTAKQFERAKISASKARKGKPQTAEHRANISKAKKGKPQTEEHREKLSGPQTAEHRESTTKAKRAKNSHLESDWYLLKLVYRTKSNFPTAKTMKILKTYFNIKLTRSQCRGLMLYNLKISWEEYLAGKLI